MTDLPSQYSEDIETFRQILNLPDPTDNIPMSSTTIWGLNDIASQQELRPKGPSAMFPVSPQLKEALDKFEQDFQLSSLPDGKFIKPPPSTSVMLFHSHILCMPFYCIKLTFTMYVT